MKPAAKLDSALKSWLDNVIIPALLQEYLRTLATESQKEVALNLTAGVLSVLERIESQRGR